MSRRALLYFIAIWFWMTETQYFGWNLMPKSDAEVICDGIALVLLAIAIASKECTT